MYKNKCKNSAKKQKNWMIRHQSRSPLNTNQFLIDRVEYADNGQSDLNYGTISGKYYFQSMRSGSNFLKKFTFFVEILRRVIPEINLFQLLGQISNFHQTKSVSRELMKNWNLFLLSEPKVKNSIQKISLASVKQDPILLNMPLWST